MTKHHTRLKEGGTSTRPPTVKLSINSGLAFGFGIRHAEPELTDACTVAPLSYCRMQGFVRLVDNLLVSHLIIISEDSLHCSTFDIAGRSAGSSVIWQIADNYFGAVRRCWTVCRQWRNKSMRGPGLKKTVC